MDLGAKLEVAWHRTSPGNQSQSCQDSSISNKRLDALLSSEIVPAIFKVRQNPYNRNDDCSRENAEDQNRKRVVEHYFKC